jgi:exopolysaccharide biosynthesis polyprenyl glycosylphosphotransferase
MAESVNVPVTSVLSRQRRLARAWPRWSLTTAERRFLLVFVDLLLVNLSLLLAVTIWNDFIPSASRIWAHAKWFLTLSAVWLGFGTVFDIYNLARSASTTSILANVGLTTLLAGLLYLFIPWLTPPMQSRSYAYGFLLISAVTTLGWRLLYAQALSQPAYWQWALILGTGEAARTLLRALQQASQSQKANPFRGTGYHVVGLVSETASDVATSGEDKDVPVLGDGRQLASLARQYDIHEIIVALDDRSGLDPRIYEALLDCRESGLRVTSFAEVYERLTARLPVSYDRQDLEVLFGPKDTASARLYISLKRLIDFVLALVGLALLGLVTPWVALGNLIWSPGPLFYRQQRVGKGGKPFVLIKFRTMIPDAEKDTGIVWSSEHDPRITPVGRILRKTRLDELPQFINVLRGEMSLIGPRPERPHFVGQLDRELPLYRARHAVKPGITGWAQVQYRYANSVEDSRIKLEYDLYYVKHAGLYLDLLIALQTIRVILQLKGT